MGIERKGPVWVLVSITYFKRSESGLRGNGSESNNLYLCVCYSCRIHDVGVRQVYGPEYEAAQARRAAEKETLPTEEFATGEEKGTLSGELKIKIKLKKKVVIKNENK